MKGKTADRPVLHDAVMYLVGWPLCYTHACWKWPCNWFDESPLCQINFWNLFQCMKRVRGFESVDKFLVICLCRRELSSSGLHCSVMFNDSMHAPFPHHFLFSFICWLVCAHLYRRCEIDKKSISITPVQQCSMLSYTACVRVLEIHNKKPLCCRLVCVI